jgi:Domain of unknown function (DUF2760)
MGRFGLAFKAFFGTLFNRDTAGKVASIFDNISSPKSIETRQPTETSLPQTKAQSKSQPSRSEALTLLEALQREARLLDLCHESLDAYSDEQIGAAARNVIRDSAQVLQRFFAFQPVTTSPEGSETEIPAGYDPARWRLTGNVSGSPPYRGRITHVGWQATRCELPQWTGSADAAFIVSAVEVEVA